MLLYTTLPKCYFIRALPKCYFIRALPKCYFIRTLPKCNFIRALPKCYFIRILPLSLIFKYPQISPPTYLRFGRMVAQFVWGPESYFQWDSYKFPTDPILLSAFSSPGIHSAWNRSAAGSYSWQLYRPSCAECQTKDGSPTFYHPSESPWFLTGKFLPFLVLPFTYFCLVRLNATKSDYIQIQHWRLDAT
jgi:hypothetical protein